MSKNFQGALWIIGSCLAATIMSLAIKGLAGNIHSTQIVLVRCVLGLLFIWPSLHFEGYHQLASSQFKLHIVRGICGAIAINLGFFSLTVLPLATVTVLFFTAPLFVTLLAIPILGEAVGWRRMVATFLGFVGTLIVVNPGFSIDPSAASNQANEPHLLGISIYMLIPVFSSMFFATSLILTKQLSKTDPPTTLMFYTFFITSLATIPFAIDNWTIELDLNWQLLLLCVALFATTRTYCDIRAYSTGEASFVSPFQYLRIVFVGIAGYFVFGEIPETNVLVGALIIVGSTLYIAHREYLSGKVNRHRSALDKT